MQISATRHSLRISTERATGFGYSFAASDVNRDASRTDGAAGTSMGLDVASPPFCSVLRVLGDAVCTGGVAGDSISRGSAKGARTLPISATETLFSAIAVASGASTSIAAPPFSMPCGPRPASPMATQPTSTNVPHNAAMTANRCGLITPPVSSTAPLEPSCTGARRSSFWDQSAGSRTEENCWLSSFSKRVAGIPLAPVITVKSTSSSPKLNAESASSAVTRGPKESSSACSSPRPRSLARARPASPTSSVRWSSCRKLKTRCD